MPTIPADLNGYAALIPPDQQVNYVGAGLQIAISSTGDSGVRYVGGDDHGQFTWSFMGYDTVSAPTDGSVTPIPGVDVAGWLVQSVFTTFWLSDSQTPNVPPVPVNITDRSEAQVIVSASAEGLGVSITFHDPSLPGASLLWGVPPLPTLL